MVQIETNNSILVKFVTYNNDNEKQTICSYYTTAIDETLKMFITAKNHEIDCCFNENSAVVEEKYLHDYHIIEDVYLGLGSNEDVPVIEVVVI